MATRLDVRRDLVRSESVQFIRASRILLNLKAARPNARINVFFDGENINRFCFVSPNAPGTEIVTDANGTASILFDIPGGTFTPGTKTIVLTDAPSVEAAEISGSVFGTARGKYSATGTVQFFQRVETTVTINEVVVVRQQSSDPLAQSFFTYGFDDGVFISSIDLYFNTKDTQGIPVRVELREMENGYPSKLSTTTPHLVSILSPDNIQISNDASVPTKFVFEPPIYADANSDFAFVVFSNSKEYNLFTSRVGDVSIESGKTIFEQPYIGSLFRSENDITWTADQFEDIKFKINRAKFSSLTGQAVFNLAHENHAVNGIDMTTTSGSNKVLVTMNAEHGLEPGSYAQITSDGLGSYNGIPSTEFSDDFLVIDTPTRKSFTFNTATTSATSTGPIKSSGVVRAIQIDAGGLNYESGNTSVSFTGGGGANAAGTPVIEGGKIVGITITNNGTGYTTNPSVVINSTSGTGAAAYAVVEAIFTIVANAPYQSLSSNFSQISHGKSNLTAQIETTLLNYNGGTISSYSAGRTIDIDLFSRTDLQQNSVMMSYVNEDNLLAGEQSARMLINMKSENDFNSPVIDIRGSQGLKHYNFIINNQTGETLTSTDSTASVATIAVTGGGSGYTLDPIVTITGGGGTGATATATRSGSTLLSIAVDTAGSGFTSIPTVTITPAPGDVTGQNGAAVAVLTPYNTELLATGGNAKSKYIAKMMNIEFPSNGIRVFSDIGSSINSSVDWYIRTSLSGSGEDLQEKEWVRLSCDKARNLSSSQLEAVEYEFYLNNMEEYDVFQLKCVLLCQDPTKSPKVYGYRAISIL